GLVQPVPVHFATYAPGRPPRSVNEPPAQTVAPPPAPSSCTASANTSAPRPAPTPLQPSPAHRATFCAGSPPAAEKAPPANSAGPPPSSWTTSVETRPAMPLPTADQD